MTRCTPSLLACCVALSTFAQAVASSATETTSAPLSVASESDPARKVLDAWLDAFNANERARLEAYRDRYQSTLDVDGMLGFRQLTGGFHLLRREPSAPGTAQALVQENDSDTVVRVEVKVQADKPPEFVIRAIQRPADMPSLRLEQAGAVAALVAKADAEAKKDAFSGVVLVARGDKVLVQRAWGLADRVAGTPVTTNTKFRLGSMNKMFTAVATLQLVQAGKLSLDGTVGAYLPGYPNAEIAKVTIRQLLMHSGGTGDIFGPEFDKQRLSLKSHDDYVRLYGARGPDHPPGKEFRYSNYGFVLLGDIIDHVSGQSYYDYVDAHVFAPAGMHDSGSLPEDVAVPNRAHAYTRKDRDTPWTDAADTLPYRGMAAGGGYSTAGDLLKFARALRSGALLPPALLAEATRRQSPGYGYGFILSDPQGVTAYGHGGAAPGMNGELRIYPTLDAVVVILANMDPQPATRLVEYYQVRMPLVP